MPKTPGFRKRPSPSHRLGSAAQKPLIAAAVGFVALLMAYLLVLRGSAADPILWLSPLPPNDEISLSGKIENIPEESVRAQAKEALQQAGTKRYDSAARTLSEVSKAYPEVRHAVAGALCRKGLELAEGDQKRKVAAVALGTTASQIAPQDWRVWFSLEKIYRKVGRLSDAEDLKLRVEETRALHPQPSGMQYALGLLLPPLAFLLAAGGVLFVLREGGGAAGTGMNTEQAIEAILGDDSEQSQAIASEGQGQITKVLGAEQRLEQAQLLIEEGQLEDAIPVFRKAVDLNPALRKKICVLCVSAGKKLYDEEKLEQAEQAFRVGVNYDPNDIRGHTFLANCMVKKGDFESAVKSYLHVCSIDPNGAIGFYNLGICYEKTKSYPDAIKAFLRASTLDPQMANANFYLGRIFEATGEKDKAIQQWEACASKAPGTPQAQRAQERLKALQGE